jgi:hypothetical protein
VEPNCIKALNRVMEKIIDRPDEIPNDREEISNQVVKIEDHIKRLIRLYDEYKN